MDTWGGLRGWQWIFLIEGAPAVVLGFSTWWVLSDGPTSAGWLEPAEKDTVARDLAQDDVMHRTGSGLVWLKVIGDAATYFMWSTGIYGLSFFLPKILVARGASAVSTGWWATLTFAMAALAMYWASHRRGYRLLPLLIFAGGIGFASAGYFQSVEGAVASFCLAAMGLLSALPIFWSVATGRLSGRAAGSAIAFINSAGAVGAFAGPYAIGWLHDATHSYQVGLWAIAACLTIGALLTLGAASRPANTASA
jgi:ACS family tartrate transporter-like MFS transporter